MPSTKTLIQSQTIGATEDADLLWIWDNSAAELDKISLGNLFTAAYNANQTFALLAGRSGGQTLIGGTAANDDLTLEGTSNATRTTSYVILQPIAGNVGIGTTSPGVKLDVNGQIRSYAPTGEIYSYSTNPTNTAKVFAGWTTNDGMQIGYYPATAQGYVENTFPIQAGDIFGDIHFRQNNAGTMVTRMTIKADGGNVGIGTTLPSKKLHVAGTILIDGDEGGIAGTIGLTDINDATLSTGNGTVKLKGATSRNNAGFIKIYVGATTAWVPYWTDIS